MASTKCWSPVQKPKSCLNSISRSVEEIIPSSSLCWLCCWCYSVFCYCWKDYVVLWFITLKSLETNKMELLYLIMHRSSGDLNLLTQCSFWCSCWAHKIYFSFLTTVNGQLIDLYPKLTMLKLPSFLITK